MSNNCFHQHSHEFQRSWRSLRSMLMPPWLKMDLIMTWRLLMLSLLKLISPLFFISFWYSFFPSLSVFYAVIFLWFFLMYILYGSLICYDSWLDLWYFEILVFLFEWFCWHWLAVVWYDFIVYTSMFDLAEISSFHANPCLLGVFVSLMSCGIRLRLMFTFWSPSLNWLLLYFYAFGSRSYFCECVPLSLDALSLVIIQILCPILVVVALQWITY